MHNSENIEKHFSQKKEPTTETITKLISQELIEGIGDLAYNTLAEFLTNLSKELPQYQKNLEKASEHIQEARKISKPFMNKNTKHKYKLEFWGHNNIQIIKEISQKSEEEQRSFLNKLWEKIEKDANADQQRGRKQLSTALFSCANSLLELSKK